jgi:hypothetical protein
MGREIALFAHARNIVGRFARPQILGRVSVAAQQLHPQQGRMPLVQMVLPDPKAQRLQQAHATDAEHDFLFEAIDLVAAVEEMGDHAILGSVLVQIGIEQQDRLASPHMTFEYIEPGADPNEAPFDRDGDLGSHGPGEGGRIPGRGVRYLTALGVDFLTEIPGSAHQAHRHQGQRQIGGRAHGIAGEHAQTAGVGGDFVAQRDFHGKVGDARLMDEFVEHGHSPLVAWWRGFHA